MKTCTSILKAMEKGKGPVNVRGWIHRERGSSKLRFLILRDASDVIQCVVEKSKVGDELFDAVSKMQVETAVIVRGVIKKDDRAPSGYEINVDKIELVGPSDTFPITKDQSIDFLADKRHLWLRSRKMTAMLKIRSTVFGAIHDFFRKNGFYEYHSPIFQGAQCEGGSTLFKVDYFGSPMYLAQTWQLYAEPAIFSLEKIYTIAPSFRAERSKTSRHLTEYWHAEMEVAWDDFEGLQDYAEGLIKHIFKEVVGKNKAELELLKRDITKMTPTIEKAFIRMKYDEAIRILKEKDNMEVLWGKDLRTIEEEKLVQHFDVPVIVTHYPKKVKAFYMKEAPENKDVVLGFDLLAPEGYGEIVGASEREENLEKLQKRLTEQGEKLEDYEFYLDTRRWGSVPHGGFGLGVERLVAWICGLETIKDAIPFPRTMVRTTP
ncbi:MAG: asparagine--tRNA ligase [Candidatus Nanoarchaeia archaeon]